LENFQKDKPLKNYDGHFSRVHQTRLTSLNRSNMFSMSMKLVWIIR